MGRRGLFIGVGILLIISVVGVLGALWLFNGTGSQNNGGEGTPSAAEPTVGPPPSPTPETVGVVVALQTLERGIEIPLEAVTTQTLQLPKAQLLALPSLITDTAQVVGKRARYTIAPGEPILTTMIITSLLSLSPQGSDAAAQIEAGKVALSLPYDKAEGVALGIKDGDHVNVIVSWAFIDIDQNFQSELPNLTYSVLPPNPEGTIPGADTSEVSTVKGPMGPFGRGENGVNISSDFYVAPAEPQRPRFVTQGIIQDAVVLHLGDFGPNLTYVEPTPTPVPATTQTPNATPTSAPPPTATPTPPDSITLVVSPQDALVLTYVKRLAERYPNSVKVTLVLRAAADNGRQLDPTNSVTLQYMFETYNIALPAKLNYGVAGPQVLATPAP